MKFAIRGYLCYYNETTIILLNYYSMLNDSHEKDPKGLPLEVEKASEKPRKSALDDASKAKIRQISTDLFREVLAERHDLGQEFDATAKSATIEEEKHHYELLSRLSEDDLRHEFETAPNRDIKAAAIRAMRDRNLITDEEAEAAAAKLMKESGLDA